MVAAMALEARILSTDVIYLLINAYACIWLAIGGYWFITGVQWFVTGIRALFSERFAAVRGTKFNIFRWIGAVPIVLFVFFVFACGSPIVFNINFVLSRSDLESLLSRMTVDPHSVAPRKVGYLYIGKIERLPNGTFRIPTEVGYGPFDAQGLIYDPAAAAATPYPGSAPLIGRWSKYCDG